MATSKSFMREPKMDTTEPSVDEVKLKRGGHAKKHMAMGGNPIMAAPMKRPMMRRPMATMPSSSMATPALLRKKGGKAHKAEGGHMGKEEAEIKRVEKELKHHESMKAKKAHHGLKMGGKASAARDDTPGGLLGGIEATRPNRKKDTGGIELSKYKRGGKMHKAEGGLAAKGDAFQSRSAMKPKIDVNDKVVSAAKNKKMGSSTGGVKNTVAGESDGGYKRGGKASMNCYAKGGTVSDSVAKRYVANMQDGSKNKSAGSKTGSIEMSKYKKGGHVKHEAHGGHVKHHEKSKKHHDASGHMSHKEHSMKHHEHGGHVHHKEHMKHGGHAKVHTTKMSTTLKRGGKACNY